MLTILSQLFVYTLTVQVAHAIVPPLTVQETPQITLSQNVKVPVVLGVMSQCPDAIVCEAVFDDVVARTLDKIDLSLTFIGKINSSEPDYGVTCKHGPAECAGNVQELCAVKYETTTTWWDFVLCQNSYGRYKVGEPEVTLQCAEKAGIDWLNGSAGRCAGTSRSEWAKGDEGIELLKESVVQTQGLGIVNSCTVVIAGKKVCVRDETWKDCEGGHTSDDFVRQIEKEFARRNNVEVEVSEDDWVLV